MSARARHGLALLPIAALCFAALIARPAASEGSVEHPKIVRLQVKKDRDIDVVLGPATSARVIVYLHGVCGNPLAFHSWARAASRHGTLISLRGDEACEDAPGRSRWSYDFDKNNRRITAAISAASTLAENNGHVRLDDEHVVLVGYSQGARRAEWLAAKFPERFKRVALIAGAFKPSRAHLGRADRVLIMAGAFDKRQHLRDGKNELQKADVPVHYLELPKARHGEYGPEALRVMGDGLVWLFTDLP